MEHLQNHDKLPASNCVQVYLYNTFGDPQIWYQTLVKSGSMVVVMVEILHSKRWGRVSKTLLSGKPRVNYLGSLSTVAGCWLSTVVVGT